MRLEIIFRSINLLLQYVKTKQIHLCFSCNYSRGKWMIEENNYKPRIHE